MSEDDESNQLNCPYLFQGMMTVNNRTVNIKTDCCENTLFLFKCLLACALILYYVMFIDEIWCLIVN